LLNENTIILRYAFSILRYKMMASSFRTIAEEMHDAYKDVDVVCEAVQVAGLANMVARLVPHMVLKG
jgi:tRNA-splicing ligase RtcB (3'-phosphate/5'-hydroxy nucleic acid ligase)